MYVIRHIITKIIGTQFYCGTNLLNTLYIHKNLFAPQAQDLLEKLAEILLYNFNRKHIFLKLKTKKLLRKISSKNLTAGVFFCFLVNLFVDLVLTTKYVFEYHLCHMCATKRQISMGIHAVCLIWPRVYQLFSCSTQMSMKFQLLIKTKIPSTEEVSCFKSVKCCIYQANKY